MGFFKKVGTAINPLDKDTYKNALNPAKAHLDAYKEGGFSGAIDPYQTMGRNQPLTDAEQTAANEKAKAEFEKEKKERRAARGYKKGGKTKMKAGGKTYCRGMGAATSGGRFRKDG